MISLALTLVLLAQPAEGAQPAEPTNPAATAPKESPPPPQPLVEPELPETRDFTLPNGLRVTLVQVGRMPKALVELAFRVGQADESRTQVGLASLTADLLLEGTKTRSAPELAAAAARWGGALETAVTPDETIVHGTVLSEFAPDLVRLVAEVATTPAFPADAFERVRKDAIREVTIARTVPSTIAIERFLSVTYPGAAYGRYLPTEKDLARYAVRDVQGFHAASYGAARAHLYVAGRFEPGPVEAAIRAALGAIPEGTPRRPEPVKPASQRLIHLVERPGAVQSSLYVGLPALDPRHPDYVKLLVSNTLLGGYFSSRMTANLREAKGYTYSPRSVLAVRAGAAGYWAQIADVTTAVTGASLREIFKEIDRLQAEPPSKEELEAVQAYLAGQFALQIAQRDELLARLRFVDLHGLPRDWLDRYVEQARAVSPEDVQRMARQWLDDARMTVVVVGDRKEVERQLKGLGRVVVSPPRS